MNRTHEDTIESHKRRKEEEHMPVHVYVERKRLNEDNYDSLPSLKKPNLDIQEKPGMYNIYIIIYTVCIS